MFLPVGPKKGGLTHGLEISNNGFGTVGNGRDPEKALPIDPGGLVNWLF